MNVTLIRHGRTAGNLRGAYIGTTDEPLCRQGERELLELLNNRAYPAADAVVASPMLRCTQTSALLYPALKPHIYDGLRECAFGAFEGLTYDILEKKTAYRAWIASGGINPPPGGEGRMTFSARCARAFEEAAEALLAQGVRDAAFLLHGGSIMAILERFAMPARAFYAWQVKNGNGFTLHLREATHSQEMRLENATRLWEEKGMIHI